MNFNLDNKCEFYRVEEDDSQLFVHEEKYMCTLENCECMFEGNGEVCPFKLGVFY